MIVWRASSGVDCEKVQPSQLSTACVLHLRSPATKTANRIQITDFVDGLINGEPAGSLQRGRRPSGCVDTRQGADRDLRRERPRVRSHDHAQPKNDRSHIQTKSLTKTRPRLGVPASRLPD